MAIDFTVGDNVVINRAYVEQILPSVDGVTLQTTVSLGYIGANPSEVLDTGSIVVSPSVTLSFIQVRPYNTSNPAYQRADGTIVYFPSDAILNNSFELSTSYIDDKQFVVALNSTGSTITKGQIVRQTGFDATQQVPIIALADATTATNSAVLGVASADILTTELGSIIITGAFEGLNTGSFSSVGAKAFLSDTPGAIATAAGTVETVVGRALSIDATNGSISLVQSLGGGGGGGGGGGFFSDGTGTNATVGKGTVAPTAGGANSFSQGDDCQTSGDNCFAQGDDQQLGSSENSFSQGRNNYLDINYSGCGFIQGLDNSIDGDASGHFMQGNRNITDGAIASFTQGKYNNNYGISIGNFVQGYNNDSDTSDGAAFVQGIGNDVYHQGGDNNFVQGTNNDVGTSGGGSLQDSFTQGATNNNRGSQSFAQGQSNFVTGEYSFAQGQENTVTGDRGFAQGHSAFSTRDDQKTWSGNRLSASLRAQHSCIVKYLSTANATQQTILAFGLEEDVAYAIRINMIAYNTTTDAEAASFTLDQAITYRNTAGSAVLVGSPVSLTLADSGGGSANLLADIASSGNVVNVRVTGELGQTYRWCCCFEFTEVAG